MSWLRSVIRARRGHPDQPRFLTYLVTFRCNARCVMCNSWQKTSGEELSLEAIEGIFRQLPRLHAVRLSGGEPFLRRDLRDIADLAAAHLRPMYLHITSNGFLTEQIVRFCETRKRALPLMLLLSLDGVGERHDAVRGIPGAWKKAMRTLSALVLRRKELNLRLAVNQTIVDAEGCAQYHALREVLAPLAIPHHVVFAYDQSATYSTAETSELAPQTAGAFPAFSELPPAELQALFADFSADLRRFAPLERLAKRYYYRGIRNRLLHLQRPAQSPLRGVEFPPAPLPQRRRAGLPVQFHAPGQPVGTDFRRTLAQRARPHPARLGRPLPRLLGGMRSAAQRHLLRRYFT